MSKNTNRRDVALRAGVSVATVSHVVNRSKYVSPELHSRVRQAIEELEYVPNQTARNLTMNRSHQIGFLVPSLSNPHFTEIAEGMEELARQKGYLLSLLSAETLDDEYIELILQKQFDGIYLGIQHVEITEKRLDMLEQSRTCFVLGGPSDTFPGNRKGPLVSHLSVNYEQGMREALHHLVGLGHRRIAFLYGLPPWDEDARLKIFRETLEELKIPLEESHILYGRPPYSTTAEEGYEQISSLLESKEEISAIVAVNDLMALGGMRAVREAGLRIPGDISVIGCDNIYFSSISEPPLTTINTPRLELGRKAMSLLLEMIEKGRAQSLSVETELIQRNSTALPTSSTRSISG